MKKFFAAIFLTLALSGNAWGQSKNESIASNAVVDEAMTDAYIVSGSGLLGAVLGLSTLSFVSDPGEHLDNIVMGGAIGVIAGVVVVAWRQSSKSKEMFQSNNWQKQKNRPGFSTSQRYAWYHRNKPVLLTVPYATPLGALQFKF